MKKFIALIMAVIMVLSLVSCGQQTGDKAEEYTRPDLSWWRENLESADADLGIGISSHGGIATAEEVFAIIDGIEFYDEISAKPVGAMDYMCHSISLTNRDEDKHINFTFYDDFNYVAIDEHGTKVDQSPLYKYSDGEKVKQFFIDKGLYMAPNIRTEIADRITALVNAGNQELLNSLSQPSGKDGSVTFVPTTGVVKDVYISTIYPLNYLDGNIDYYANVDLVYDYGAEQLGFCGLFVLDKNFELTKVYLTPDENLPLTVNPYTIAGVDYSIWMEKLDNPVNNQFNYQLVGGGYGMGSSGMEWNTSIMRCIDGLQLGELADINTKDYPYQQTYSILLSESNPNYDAKPLIFSFYDDCNYLIICDCRDELGHTVCDNHTQGYKVENPETVRQLFGMKGQYVPADDYKSLEKFADDYLKKTSVAKLNSVSSMDEEIPADYTLQGDIAKLTASQKANTEGKLKYSINFVAMYAGTLPNGNRHFVTYKIYMTVAQQGSSWQMEEMAISNY